MNEPLKLAQLRRQGALNGANPPHREPIAIVGIGCRFPGKANSPDAYWNLIEQRVDAVIDIPPNRWDLKSFYDPRPSIPGKTNIRHGGFLEQIDQFDPDFFGISPREASRMDPQQRLLLEVAWEALEDSGQVLERLQGSPTGVFVGISSWDYTMIQAGYRDRKAVDVYTNTGGALSIAANRISYCFDFTGPSMAIDTACSSGLTAVHLACRSLWQGDCHTALAGAVSMLITPGPYLGFSMLSMLSPDGRCKAFDAQANGFVRSEGAGIVVLKPLSQAILDGDPIYALIRGTAINQDGATSGLTVPSQAAQNRLIHEACRTAGVEPHQIQFVEAHGTGTLVGDPIEARALGEALRVGRAPQQPCRIGSVKTNVGHLESAAGIAGLIKVALALKNATIPANLHFQNPNPDIDFQHLGLTVPTTSEPWPLQDGTRLAGINSFGFGGSNAHVVLEGFSPEPTPLANPANHHAPRSTPQPRIASNPNGNGNGNGNVSGNGNGNGKANSTLTNKSNGNGKSPHKVSHLASGNTDLSSPPSSPTLIPLSARSPHAVRDLAQAYASFLQEHPCEWPNLLHTLRHRRTHHEHRAAIVASSTQEFIQRLKNFATGEREEYAVHDRKLPNRNDALVFVCCGQGPQWWAMGRELYHQQPIFRDLLDRCDHLISQFGADWSLVQQLHESEETSRMNDTAIAQPAIFAIQVGLAALWNAWGIRPTAIIGHSVGEIAAAHLAGVLSFEDAVRVIYHRGRSMSLASKQGGMLAVGLNETEAEPYLEKFQGQLGIAAINAPRSLTISGNHAELQILHDLLQRERIYCKFLRVNQAFHSHHMDPAREDILSELHSIQPQSATLPLISTVDGSLIEGHELTAEYWWKNIRQTVRFAQGIDRLLEQGYSSFLELSPHPVLVSSITECAHHRDKPIKVFSSLKRQEPESASMLRSLGALYCAGQPFDWHVLQASPGAFVRLPSYPWQRELYWHEAEESRDNRLGMQGLHPLLGRDLKTSSPLWQSTLSLAHLPYMQDHQVQSHVLIPGTAMLETALAAGKVSYGSGPYFLENVKFLKAIFLSPGTERLAQTTFNPLDATFNIRTGLAESNSTWAHNCTGKITSRSEEAPTSHWSLQETLHRCPDHLAKDACYQLFEKLDIKYGPNFQGIQQLWRGDREAVGEIHIPEPIALQLPDYQFHPAVLDACLQCVFGTIPLDRMNADTGKGVFLPVEMQEVRVYRGPAPHMHVHARLESLNRQGVTVQLQVYDLEANLLVDIRGLVCQYVGMQGDTTGSLEDLLYEFKWHLAPRQTSGTLSPLHSLPSLQPLAAHLDARLDANSPSLAHPDVAKAQGTLVRDLNQLAAAYVVEAFQKLGWKFTPQVQLSADSLIRDLGISDQHHRILPRYLDMLAEEGILAKEDNHYRVLQQPNFEPTITTWRRLLQRHPAFYAELTMIRRCASRLDEVLQGHLNPLQLIFPDGSLDTAEHLYQDSPSVRVYNALTQKAISEVISQLPRDRRIRILEIGAGTGGLTSYLLPHLPPDRTQYVFTDLSNHFFNKGKQKFADFPFLEYQLLDIEKDPIAQGFAPHSFDLVIASQVLHATQDLTNTLTHVRYVLAHSGLLVMLELLKPARWVDLVFGLTEGWWRFNDLSIRPNYPLLTFDKWSQLLSQLHFAETINLAEQHQVDGFGSAVIFSRATSTIESSSTPLSNQTTTDNNTIPIPTTPDAQPAPLQGPWLLFADQQGLANQIASQIELQNGHCTFVRPGTAFRQVSDSLYEVSPTSLDDFQLLLQTVADAANPPRIIHLWNLDAPSTESLDADRLLAAHDLGCLSLVHLYQAWSKTLRCETRNWVITRGAQDVADAIDKTPIQLAQTNVWGLGRVLFNEYSKIQGRMIDLGSPHATEIDTLIAELSVESSEDEVALRGEARYVNRYVRGSLTTTHRHDPCQDGSSAYRLECQRGELDALAFRRITRLPLDPNQVEIEVRATALNFSDVMKALGLYPGLPDGPVPIGIECAGRVVAVGTEVKHIRVGDDVMALAPFAFGSHVTTFAPLCAPMPKHCTYAEATTLPIAFLTAHYALVHLAQLQPGERVLIHSATGGVGLAAIQVAQAIGAEIFATAGSPEKREFLHSMGIQHVMDSRSLQFADQIMDLTQGQGVDVVLNSLSGDAINKSLSILGEYGRFLEIGKRDIYMNSQLGMRPFRKNVSFIAIDLDRVMRQRPALMSEMFQQIAEKTACAQYNPLPHRIFSATNIKSAFRYMAQAKHLGKVVVSFEDAKIEAIADAPLPIQFHDQATYLITGGLGGFGLLVARWMAEQGARHFILMGRRGIHSTESQEGVEALRKMGADVHIVQGDVSKIDDVRRALDAGTSMPPLRGILHAAMHLEDCLLNHLDRDTMLRVVAPKMLGAWNLHSLTESLPLDFFLCFSSMGSVFGMPGQANYAAGNLFLDTLPAYRRRSGKAGLTINWGYLREVGYVAERAELVERFESQGFSGISPREALSLLGRLLSRSSPQVSIVRMDWSRARDLGLASLIAPRFHDLTDRIASTNNQEGTVVRKALLAVLPEKRKPILLNALKERVAAVLGASPDKIDVDTPLTDVGVDSLMAVELRNWVESELRVSLPIVELMEGPTVNRLADLLLEQFAKGDSASNEKASQEPATTLPLSNHSQPANQPEADAASRVASMDDSEVDAMLNALVNSGTPSE